MIRITTAVAAAAVALGSLTACGRDQGGSPNGDYCAGLEAAKKQVDALQGGDFGALEQTTETMRDLAHIAPVGVVDAWMTLVEGADRVEAALRAVGLSDEDLAGLMDGQVPDGVDIGALQDLVSEIAVLGSADFQRATERVRTHAADDCGIDLRA